MVRLSRAALNLDLSTNGLPLRLRLQWDCLNYRTDPRAWLQIAADLIRAARVGLDVLGLVAEPGEGVAQVVEFSHGVAKQ